MVAQHVTQTTPQTRYFHKDHLGSITALTNESGTVVERNSFDAWGERRVPTGLDDPLYPALSLTSQITRGYTGHEQLDAVGLVHMNGRIYDPIIGKMMSPDPTVPDPVNQQAYNRYAYVLNNPLSLTDPTGFEPRESDGNPRDDDQRDKNGRPTRGGNGKDPIGGKKSREGGDQTSGPVANSTPVPECFAWFALPAWTFFEWLTAGVIVTSTGGAAVIAVQNTPPISRWGSIAPEDGPMSQPGYKTGMGMSGANMTDGSGDDPDEQGKKNKQSGGQTAAAAGSPNPNDENKNQQSDDNNPGRPKRVKDAIQDLPEKYRENPGLFGRDSNQPSLGTNGRNPSGQIDPGTIDTLKANGVTRQNISDLARGYAEEAQHVKSTSPQTAAARADYFGRMLDSW